MKTINKIVASKEVDMGGHIIEQPLPNGPLNYIDPFLLIHHWKKTLPGGKRENEVGVGPHPHRGFSPVTFIFEGNVVHRDSLGNKATVGKGGTQWMFAGKGITHSERQSKEIAENGGETEFIQFWVNAPAKHKLDPAFYKPISEEETPLIEDEGSKLWVVSGDLEGITGIAPTVSPLLLLRGELMEGFEKSITIPKSYSTLIYLLDGEMEVNGEIAKAKDLIHFKMDGSLVNLKANQKTRYIVLAGEPLKEEVASYGPFVMNNQTQLMEALRDAQMGKMGVLIEEFDK